jgi:hypothetical protein
VKKSFNIQELLHSKSKHHKIKAHAPLLIERFPKTSRIQSESSRFSGSHTYKTKQTTFLHKSIVNELQWIEGHGHLEQFAFVPPIPVNVANCIKWPRSIQSHRSPTPSREFKVVLRNLWCNHPKNNVAKLSYILYMKFFFKKNLFILLLPTNLSWKFGNITFLIFKIWKLLANFLMFSISQNHFSKLKFVKSLLVKNTENPIDPSH